MEEEDLNLMMPNDGIKELIEEELLDYKRNGTTREVLELLIKKYGVEYY